MMLVDLEYDDIKLDERGQPVIGNDGDFALISGKKCFLQDLRNEILTEQAELFYEDEDEDDSYGFGLLEFKNETYSEFLGLEIERRIKEKLKKREEIDPASINTELIQAGDKIKIVIHFKLKETDEEYDAEISENRVEVVKE
ncbi:MAG: DUF2634 domain-containing protein [Hungatella sp.]|nr:DUF2634 domain-containing protein [Dorea sp.]MCI9636203.1 DUF2634 domain-containing protein [Hungatella sp.]